MSGQFDKYSKVVQIYSAYNYIGIYISENVRFGVAGPRQTREAFQTPRRPTSGHEALSVASICMCVWGGGGSLMSIAVLEP